jgi:heat shock protein HslJ
LLVPACRTSGPPEAAPGASVALAGTSWIVEQIDGSDVVDRAPTVAFDTSGRVSGGASCNRYTARAAGSGETLRIEQAAMTKMACSSPVMEQERRFLAALGAVTESRRDGGRLLLVDRDGRVRLRLRPGPAATGARQRARSYECEGGLAFVIALPRGVDAVDVAGARRLPHVPAASGARYTDGQVTFWSRGAEALLERDGRTWRCTARALSSAL